MELKNITEEEKQRWDTAEKRMKSIKRFYMHLFTFFIIVPLILLIRLYLVPQFLIVPENEGFNNWLSFNFLLMPILWGIVVAIHGLIVFSNHPLKKWEKKKISEVLDKEYQESKQNWN